MSRRHVSSQKDIPLDQIVRRAEKWPTSVSWPAPVDKHLDSLVSKAIEAGEADALSRSELLAALVVSAPKNGKALREALETYRSATVGELFETDEEVTEASILSLGQRRPGRR